MKEFPLVFPVVMVVTASRLHSEVVIGAVFAWQTSGLNGKWHVIIDP